MKPFRIALIQNIPGYDTEKSISKAFEMIAIAAQGGAELVCLPEMFYHPFELDKLSDLKRYEKNLRQKFSDYAKIHSIYLFTGTFVEQRGDGALMNTALIFAPDGSEILHYSKCHLFDVTFKNLKVKESSVFSPGDTVAGVETELCSISALICYDIRFPEIARMATLQGADLLIVPAVFNQISGPAHWHLFMRCRAVENQIFLAAVSQGRNEESQYKAYGHSLVVSPWGDILAEAGEGEEILYADINPGLIQNTRARLPLLKHRRSNLYNLTGGTE
ncbi:carbon-nitrogen hydrolase [Chitinispirillum alkaliphilum]|nr:carbon-nitrogen hydrolase [Chitinispirillum alkaliphilum]